MNAFITLHRCCFPRLNVILLYYRTGHYKLLDVQSPSIIYFSFTSFFYLMPSDRGLAIDISDTLLYIVSKAGQCP